MTIRKAVITIACALVLTGVFHFLRGNPDGWAVRWGIAGTLMIATAVWPNGKGSK